MMNVSAVDVQALSLDEKNALWDLFNEAGMDQGTAFDMELFFAKLKAVFQEDINAAVEEHEQELEDMEDDYAVRMQKKDSDHDELMQKNDSDHEQEVDNLTDEIARLKIRVDELEQE